MCNFKSQYPSEVEMDVKITEKNVLKILISIAGMYIGTTLLTFSIAFVAPFLITQVFGGGVSAYEKPALIASIITFIFVKILDLYLLSDKYQNITLKNRVRILIVQYGLDIVTPMCFIVGFLGYSTWWYVVVGVVSSAIMGISYGRKLATTN